MLYPAIRLSPHPAVSVVLATIVLAAGLTMPFATAQETPADCPAPQPTTAPAGSPDPGVLYAHRFGTGEGIKVAVIDTGVFPHPRLGEVLPGGDFLGGGGELFDCDGHGTIVAGVIAARPVLGDSLIGIAPGAQIISIRQSSAALSSTTPDQQVGTVATLADAINNALDQGAQVINVSLASCISPEVAESSDTSVLDRALERAETFGTVVVAAAGNIGPACPAGSIAYPASAKTVLAVSAAADSHSLADYSLAVSGPAISAPGLVSVGLSPRDDGFATAMQGRNGATAFQGTSFAAPVVSGIAALLKQRYPGDSAESTRQRILAASVPGTGNVTADSALAQLLSDEQPRSIAISAPEPHSPQIRHRSILLAQGAGATLAGGLLLAGLLRRERSKP